MEKILKRGLLVCISLIIILIIVISLSGCSVKITEGEVYDKEYKEAHKKVMIIPITTYNGKTSSIHMIPYVYNYPDRYIIRIKKFIDNNWKQAEYYVPKEVYDSINVGDQFEYVEGRDLTEEPYTREKE